MPRGLRPRFRNHLCTAAKSSLRLVGSTPPSPMKTRCKPAQRLLLHEPAGGSMDADDSIDGIRPVTGELPPEVWAAKLLDQLDPAGATEAIEEPVEEDGDESAWQAALAAANARAAAERPIETAHVDGIADETGPHHTATAEVPKTELEALIDETAPLLDADSVA